MSKSYKKLLSAFLSVVLVLTLSCAGFVAFGEDVVAINETNFPDAQFRAIVAERFDSNEDGFLEAAERNNVRYFQISGYVEDDTVIRSIQGIQFFPNVTNLRCAALGLESLDVSALTNLNTLTCEGNELTTLDVSSNTNLRKLVCRDNMLTNITFGTNSNLTEVYCETNKLTRIDTSGLRGLKYLSCYQNELRSLDLVYNTELEDLSCASNHLAELDLSYNPNLIDVSDEQLADQTVSATAVLENGKIKVPYYFPFSNRLVWTSLDTVDESTEEGAVLSGYRNGAFYADDVSQISTVIDESLPEDMNIISYGIEYRYYTGNPNAADLSVGVEVSRSFHQVDYYTSEDMSTKLMSTLVEMNQPAAQPEIPDAPTCKTFAGWSEDVSSVTEDMQVYIVWDDDHSYDSVIAFDGEYATLSCRNSDSTITVKFIDSVNTSPTNENYYKGLDVVADGYINAKDFARLKQMFR